MKPGSGVQQIGSTPLLQKNVLDRKRWATREEFRFAIVVWIERTYRRRRQRALGRLTPIECEILTTVPN
jgi:putative transposase